MFGTQGGGNTPPDTAKTEENASSPPTQNLVDSTPINGEISQNLSETVIQQTPEGAARKNNENRTAEKIEKDSILDYVYGDLSSDSLDTDSTPKAKDSGKSQVESTDTNEDGKIMENKNIFEKRPIKRLKSFHEEPYPKGEINNGESDTDESIGPQKPYKKRLYNLINYKTLSPIIRRRRLRPKPNLIAIGNSTQHSGQLFAATKKGGLSLNQNVENEIKTQNNKEENQNSQISEVEEPIKIYTTAQMHAEKENKIQEIKINQKRQREIEPQINLDEIITTQRKRNEEEKKKNDWKIVGNRCQTKENKDNIVLKQYDEARWVESFRMKRTTFFSLCDILRNKLAPKFNPLKPREPVSVEKQVAVALYKLASSCEYRVVGDVFGIHKSTVKKCFYNVITAINVCMSSTYITMPNLEECQDIAWHFEQSSKIPQIIGCIDGCHIPILAPAHGYRDYVNRKGWPSYNFQAVVDHQCRFRNVCVKHPGNTHDAVVFKQSGLFRNYQHLIPQNTKSIQGKEIPFMIVGDPAYPLLPWLLKGFPGTVTPQQESFNIYLSSARVAVEMAFGRLKGKWIILLKRIDVHYSFVPKIINSCCILHNFLENNKEMFIQAWLNDVLNAEIMFPQPHQPIVERLETNASEIRNTLKEYLATNFPLRQTIIK